MAVIPVPPVYLVSTDGQQWQLTAENGGAPIHTDPVTGEMAFASILVNDIGMQQTWRLTIVPNPSPYMGASPGDIHIDPVTYSPSTSVQIMVNSPDGTLWWIQILNGLLQTNPGTVGSCTPAIGSLYYPRWNNIAWSQPGGVGTEVFPQQNNGPFTAYPVPGQFFGESSQALWRAGCGHGFDAFEVFRDFNVCTNQSCAIQTCPICTFIVNVISPYEAIFDVIQFPILV